MNVGDLIVFHNCAEEGTFGIIIMVPTSIALYGPGSGLYWVLHARGVACFTGWQLELV